MILKQKNRFSKILFLAVVVMTGCGFVFSGCAQRGPNIINPAVTGPQVIVKPDAISLGVATLMATDIVFEGAGFQPGDSVFISLAKPDQTKGAITNRIVNPDGTFTIVSPGGFDSTGLVVAQSKVNQDGAFTATVGILAKVNDILRADLAIDTYSEDAEYKNTLVLTQEPVPAGVYTARATGMLSDQTAETTLIINNPSITDRLKDWIGKKMGKIQDKRN
jgi:tetrahydromethanopterin S-methyltransferase subunit F